MSKVRYKIVVSDEVAAKVERQAEQAGWTPEMWIEWLVADYIEPDLLEGGGDE